MLRAVCCHKLKMMTTVMTILSVRHIDCRSCPLETSLENTIPETTPRKYLNFDPDIDPNPDTNF